MKKIKLTILILILHGNVWASQQPTESQILTNDFNEAEQMINSQQDNNDIQETLSCTCYGGPGNYRYQCAPVAKTCYGGPGNYQYTCYTCP